MSYMSDAEILDRDLLEVMIKEQFEKLTEEQLAAFTDMADQKSPINPKQSEWIRSVAKSLGVFAPPAENLFSSMTPAEQAKHREKAVTRLPWESGAMTRPAKPPGKKL